MSLPGTIILLFFPMVQLIYLLFPYTIILHVLVQLLNQLFKWLISLHVIPLEQLSFLLF